MKKQMTGRKAYNDGVLFICDPPEKCSSFGAVQNAAKAEDLKKIVKLSYQEMSKRDQDIAFAQSRDRQLSMKVKAVEHKEAGAEKNVLIRNVLYSVIYIDHDRKNHEMYLYLQEERKL